MQLKWFLFFFLTISIFPMMQSQSLEDYKWKNRILVLADHAIDTEPMQSQLSAFKTEEEALLDRNLIIFQATDDIVYDIDGTPTEIDIKQLRKNLNISQTFKGVLLIGKDGGVKMKEKFQVNPKTVFTLIDGMPMRRAEMRKSGKS